MNFKKIISGALLLGALVSITSCEKALSEADFAAVSGYIAKTVPLVIEKSTGKTVYSNDARKATATELPIPDLDGGNDLFLITEGEYAYEDDDNEKYLYGKYTVTWTYYDQGKEDSDYGKFTFETDKDGKYNAIPGYPTYKPEYDGGGNALHVLPPTKSARLIATIKIGSLEKKVNFDMFLQPTALVEYYNFAQVRELAIGEVAGIRGYVTGIFPDWNTASIADGEWGFGLFRLDSGFANAFKVGDLIQVVGQYSVYNGLAQFQYIKKVTIIDEAQFPNIKKPIVNELTTDDLKDQLERSSTDLTGPLQDKESSLAKFNKPFTFKRVENREAVEVGFAGFDITGKLHTNVILETETSEGVKFEVKLSINYHMGVENQTAIKNFLVENQSKPIYYNGHLSAYNGLVLGPYNVSALSLTA